ncbi:MAG: hypothetical protein KDG89_17880 [Geminicoccaceae bacterium]|nr:hypothetical protein [Geminicoccaceae bacterium]
MVKTSWRAGIAPRPFVVAGAGLGIGGVRSVRVLGHAALDHERGEHGRIDGDAEATGRQAGVDLVVLLMVADHLKASGDAAAAAKHKLALVELLADAMSFPELGDPALSDLATQRLRDTAVRLLLRAEALATGGPFDPGRYQGSHRRP